MKITLIILALIGVSIFIYSCSGKSKNKKVETTTLDPNEIQPGPIQHEKLSDSQLQKIKSIHEVFKEVYPISLEETITNFKRDLNVDREINLWLIMKESFEYVITIKNYESVSEKKDAFKLILMRTIYSTSEETKNSVELEQINNADADFILTDFENRLIK